MTGSSAGATEDDAPEGVAGLDPTAAPVAGLGRAAAAGAVYTGAAQAVKVLATLVSAVVVARILSPADYGVIAMATPIMGFLLIFQSLGLNQSMINQRHVSPAQMNSLFWLNMAASAVIALLLLALAPIASAFYHDRRAGPVLAAYGLTVLVTGLGQQHAALLNRDLRFRALAVSDVAASVVTVAATAVAAWLTRSYWALWLGGLLGALAGLAVLWRADPWRPGPPAGPRGSGGLVRLGAWITGFNVLSFLARNSDNVLIARVWGSAPLGLYDRAYKLMIFPMTNVGVPLQRVLVPVLRRHEAPADYRRLYGLALRGLLMLVMPGVLVAACAGDAVIAVLLGARWAGAAPVFTWLSLAALVQPLVNAAQWVFLSTGRGRDYFAWGVFAGVTTVGSFLVGLPGGAVGVARAYAIAEGLRLPLLFWWTARASPVRAADYYRALLPFAPAALAAWGAVRLLKAQAAPAIVLVSGALLASYATALAAQLATASGREALRSAWARRPHGPARPLAAGAGAP